MSWIFGRFGEYPGLRALFLLLGCLPALAVASRAAVTFEAVSSATVNSGTSILIAKPTGTAKGDLLIAALVVDDDDGSYNANDLTAPAGWTLIDRGPCPTTDGGSCALGSWWKIVPPDEGGFYIFEWTGGSTEPAAGAILRYSGTDPSDPIGAVATDAGAKKANNSDSPVAPSVTTLFDGSVVLRILGNDRVGTWSPDASHVSRQTGCNSSPDPNKVCLALADKSQATAGSAGSMAWSGGGGLENIFWRSLSIEIVSPQPRGDIEIFKGTLPDGGTDLFDFTTSGLVPTSFDLMDDESQLFAGVTSGSGLYSVSETVPAGWTRISYCDIGFPGNVEVVTGMTTQCHFVNVDETQVPRCDMVGPVDNNMGTGLASFNNYDQGLYFDALAPFVLRAVHVFPLDAGDIVVNLKKNGTLLATRTVAVAPAVASERTRIELDLPVPAGSGYELDAAGTSTGGLYRNSAGAAFPYSGEFVEITGVTFSNQSYYYFFYDWEVERMDAVGASSKEFGSGTYTNLEWRLEFDASEPTRIHSVHVYPQTAGNVAIELRDSSDTLLDSVIQTVTASPPEIKTPIELDFLVPAGTGFSLGLDLASTTAALWRNFSGGAYPFSTSSLSITGNSFGNSSYYYYFYDWLFRPARVGWDVRLNDLTIDDAMTVRACETATLGPDLDLVFPADLDVQAGSQVNLESPFDAGSLVLLEVGIDPALLPD